MQEPEVLPFTNPATGQTFGQVAITPPAQVQAKVRQLKQVAPLWAARPLADRIRILRKFQAVLVDALDEITAVMTQDCGKSRQDALIEVFMTVDFLQTSLRHAPRWLGRERIPSGLYLFKHVTVEPRPYGVVAIIAPWNYPFALSVPNLLAALLAGNAVAFKPSEVTPAVGVLIEQLFERVPELAPYVCVLHGDGRTGAALLQSGPDAVFLTGSVATGQRVLQAAAEHLIPVTAELGGKDPMIVLDDADLPAAAHWGVWGACFNTGQTCMSVERVYVAASVYDEFVRLAVEEARKLKVGYTLDKNSPFYIGPMTDPRQVKIIERHLEDALQKGARVLTGGGHTGMFYEPTVLVDVDHSMLLMREETFGPLMPIMKVASEQEAIQYANDSDLGLSASVWSQNLERAARVALELQAGSVLVNDVIAQFAIPLLPFGGVKKSGYGRTHGKEGLLQFTQPQALVVSPPPYPFDFATLARKPGNYTLIATMTRLLFGVGPRQRLEPLKEISAGRISRPAAAGLGLSLAAFAALASLQRARQSRRRIS